jgi:hypothetical protein
MVGKLVEGDFVGERVGSLVVGAREGKLVVGERVGTLVVGDTVGTDVVGECVGWMPEMGERDGISVGPLVLTKRAQTQKMSTGLMQG